MPPRGCPQGTTQRRQGPTASGAKVVGPDDLTRLLGGTGHQTYCGSLLAPRLR
jgi:hypothetical protein